MPQIETSRLQLRQFSINDLDALAAILSNPEVMKYSPLGAIPVEQVTQVAQEKIKVFNTHWQKHNFGVWAVIDKHAGKLIGLCGLIFLPNSPEVEVVYRFEQAYWNRGIATEAVQATLRYGFEQVKLNRIVAITLPEHIASRRVMEKAGLKYEKDAHFYNLDVVYYAISATEWQDNITKS